MILDKKCKKCRRAGEKLFLKGERCNSPKCAMVKRNYPPGVHGQKGYMRLSSYGVHLKEKQKVKHIYNITEKQLGNYMKKALSQKGNTGEIFLGFLERRFDNIIHRLGFASSRPQARELVNHGHFLLNNKKATIPSHSLRAGDEITLKDKSLQNKFFKNLSKAIEKHDPPSWITLDKKNLKGVIVELPKEKDLELGIQTELIVEYYSR